ncbi:hypothetical protein NL676_001085 [Syzygium grande]|nr:hypothetical protein NL676_001085 [Syzygium grande]
MFTHRRSSPATLRLLLLLYFLGLVLPQPTANLSTTWAASSIASVSFGNGSPVDSVKPIILRGNDVPTFACGFVRVQSGTGYLFAISIVYTNASQIDQTDTAFPEVVWAANRNYPMVNPTLELTSEGDLVLKDAGGTVAWSTDTSGKSVIGLNLTDSGNLVLFDANNAPVWQSFDHPTDSLVLGQKLSIGQKLVPSVSETNWTAQSLLSLSMTSTGLFPQMDTDPPQAYFPVRLYFPNTSNDSNYIEFINGTLALFTNSTRNGSVPINIPPASLFMRLEYDGHLRAYEFDRDKYQWTVAADLLGPDYGDCGYPTVCGQYGICTSNGQCTCPDSNGGTAYFKQINDRYPNLGCYEEVPLSCNNSQFQSLLELGDLAYFTYGTDPQSTPDLANVTKVNCKEACAKNCSCKAAFFHQSPNIPSDSGSCYLLSEVFSLMNLEEVKNSTGYIKVQNISNVLPNSPGVSGTPDSKNRGKTNRLALILGSSLGSVFALIIVIGAIKVFSRKREVVNEDEEDHLDQIPGMPMRFTYNSLKVITEEFSKKLGEGGFGSVFEGTLKDGSKVAVKCLDGLGHIKKSFLAEVADFGLSKLIDRDKSQVVTNMRGTPGYLAPEWLSATITEKVDVYSFGVVVLEIVSARKIFDDSQDAENTYLVGAFRRKAEEGRFDRNGELEFGSLPFIFRSSTEHLEADMDIE